MGKQWKQWQTLFWGASKSLQMVIAAMKLKDAPWKKSYDQPRQHIKKQRHYFTDKGPSSQSYGFSSNHVWMWELNYKESWALKNWCFWTVVLEKTLESPLDCKEIQSVLNIHWKDWCWSWNSNTLATWCEELTHWKRLWYWERLSKITHLESDRTGTTARQSVLVSRYWVLDQSAVLLAWEI